MITKVCFLPSVYTPSLLPPQDKLLVPSVEMEIGNLNQFNMAIHFLLCFWFIFILFDLDLASDLAGSFLKASSPGFHGITPPRFLPCWLCCFCYVSGLAFFSGYFPSLCCSCVLTPFRSYTACLGELGFSSLSWLERSLLSAFPAMSEVQFLAFDLGSLL